MDTEVFNGRKLLAQVRAATESFNAAFDEGVLAYCPICGAPVEVDNGGHWALVNVWHSLNGDVHEQLTLVT